MTSVRLCILACVLGLALAAGVSSQPGKAASKPATNLDYWLNRARTTPATTATAAVNPFGRADRFSRPDALPGVVLLSDGKVLPGGIFTTRDKNWEVWVASQKRWRHIPPIMVLSIRAVVVEEAMEKEWRWKEMGRNERVFTGRTQPTRRLAWRFHLIDDSYVTGEVKGQPLWIETAGKRQGPFILHERSKGKFGQTLRDLVYLKYVVISRRAMEEVLKITPATSSRKENMSEPRRKRKEAERFGTIRNNSERFGKIRNDTERLGKFPKSIIPWPLSTYGFRGRFYVHFQNPPLPILSKRPKLPLTG